MKRFITNELDLEFYVEKMIDRMEDRINAMSSDEEREKSDDLSLSQIKTVFKKLSEELAEKSGLKGIIVRWIGWDI